MGRRGARAGALRPVPARRFFFFNDTATTEIYTTEDTLSLHDALPIFALAACDRPTEPPSGPAAPVRSEEHTSELQSPSVSSYAVFCLKKKKNNSHKHNILAYSKKKKTNQLIQTI